MTPTPTVLLEGLAFPEGPRWRDGRLWFSEFVQRTVSTVTLAGTTEIVLRLEDSPSGLGFLPDGTPIVVSMHQRQLLRIVDGHAELHADLGDVPGDFLNDMVVDGSGNAYVGTRHAAMRPGLVSPSDAPDAIMMVTPDGTVAVAADQLVAPNGTVITPDGRTLILAETYAHRLTAFDRRSDGSLANRRVFADVGDAYPDGICLDDEGAVWFGSPYTDEFLRVREGGEITDRIELPGGVACALGGEERDVLFLLGVDPAGLPVPGVAPGASAAPAAPAERRTGGHIWTLPVRHRGAGWP